MKRLHPLISALLLVLFFLTACVARPASPTPEPTPIPATPVSVASPTPADHLSLTILYTDDEHGWFLGQNPGQGAAELMGLWRQRFGYDPADPHFLLLSGGDNWTGPAASTWFKGESMVEVMNAMGYDASAVGNHEFDFGLDELQQRVAQAHFPYLAANMAGQSAGKTSADLGIRPYTLIDVDGWKIGVIGLANVHTPKVTNPAHVKGLRFEPYAETLARVVPQVRDKGADSVMVISHLCNGELLKLALETHNLGIRFFGGGHCHETLAQKGGGAVLLTGGPYFLTYAWARVQIDRTTGKWTVEGYDVDVNQGGKPDPAVAAVAQTWQEEAQASLGEPIGYLAQTLPERSEPMLKLITESWLWSFPQADVAITNRGGVRDDLRAGPVTPGDIISMMPFDNVIIDMRMTGAQLRDFIHAQKTRIALGGLDQVDGQWILRRTRQPLDPQQTYRVLVNDYMYAGGSTYGKLAQYDPHGYDTGVDWRQPVMEWIIAQHSTADQPLDDAIEALFRDQDQD